MATSKTRFILIGGFLGAGKTTLIGQLATRYIAAGKRVGIITNDQAADLVDTNNLRSQGFNVGEVAGACFCCSFDDLVATADRLSGEQAPEVLLAEPVGSCTDLVATVILPLQQMLGERFELAPFGVLLKPSHGQRILSSGKKSGFSPQADYIFRKQLEEADYVMIGRRDELDDQQIESLQQSLAVAAPDVPFVAVSPQSGEGIDEVLGHIESPLAAGRRVLEIDYDTYAAGEAELGWVNLTANLATSSPVDLDAFAKSLVGCIANRIVDHDVGQIAHLKASVLAGDSQAVANVVDNGAVVDMGLRSGRSSVGPLQAIINARVAMDPHELETICRQSVTQAANSNMIEVQSTNAHALRPGRPEPTHRVGHSD